MTFHSIGSRRARSHASRPREQRGVVLFIALIVMVALSLAGIALIRSTDTTGIVAGNLAFKQAAMSALDRSVESAVNGLWDMALDKTADATGPAGQNYFACVQAVGGGCIAAGAAIPQIPKALDPGTFSAASFTGAPWNLRTNLVDGGTGDSGGNRSYYMVERMCLNPGLPLAPNCNLSSAAFGADPGTEHYFGLIRPGDAYYRITIRVEGPRNTVTYAQAILQ
jgi:hypothetical protein